jgi:hypothetical protein
MKRTNHTGELLALILAVALCAFTPSLAAQSRDNGQQQGAATTSPTTKDIRG